MVTRKDYSEDLVKAARMVLLEIMHLLGEYRELIVLVGGWIPELLIPQTGMKHIGSMDIDLAMDHRTFPPDGYRRIKELLTSRGYREGKQPFIFYRTVTLNNRTIDVEIDFLAGEYEEAVRLVMERNPFPFSVGRVCPRFCETRCRRILVDEPISINHLKRFVADWCMQNKIDLKIPTERPTGKRIAIIGGGPAGLTSAYYLARKGHDVTIFEAMPKLGGMLRYGLPDYKIPQNILDYETTAILRMGISVKFNQRWGRDFTLQDLKDQNFSAIFIGVGAWVPQPLNIPGANSPGVFAATDFLRQVAEGKTEGYGRRAAVIGGNNIALEAARSLLRVGVDEVTIIYPKSRTGMTANQRTIDEAEGEGVHPRYDREGDNRFLDTGG